MCNYWLWLSRATIISFWFFMFFALYVLWVPSTSVQDQIDRRSQEIYVDYMAEQEVIKRIENESK